MGNRLVEPRTTHLIFTSTKLEKKLIICLLFFILATTAEATEYTVSPFPSDQSGASINGEEVIELKDFTVYWQFLLWLALMHVLSIIDILLNPAKLIFAILGFRIVDGVNVLDNPARDSIYAYIKANPGVCFSDIAKSMGLNRGTVKYHIQILETQKKIDVYKDSGKIRYFQNNSMYGEREKKVLVASQSITNQRIISEILNGKCNTNVDLAREIGVSRGTISWYMKNLKEIGLIKETKRGRSVIYKISISYKNLIEKYR